ncbi:MAG: PAS domain-containing protein [Gracilimonas sp.]|uniref:histidine kinase dimerization/phosphoacceptor domain -containing protein n=1 Tax=Gracilimonas sp. TaxID=1974203 RepID=UPI0019939619|nr:histidine kinase dimerization/phosphoacceptor domain -containing protein [Gracilimonas sp.]MBD3616603.1 PAS domain-containing protein [Gracilimonas sp.]
MYKDLRKGRLDVDRKLFSVVVFGFICALLLILTVNFSINTSSGIRAYVAGEAYWAKAQKEAAIHLSNYLLTENERDYQNFKSVLKINEGDRIAREELLKEEYDYQTVYEGFITGKNHPDDIPDMINLFRRFKNVSHVKEAVDIWAAADKKIEELITFADSIRSEIQRGDVGLMQKEEWLLALRDLDHELTDLEYQFSLSMGNMARLVNDIFRWTTIILGLLLISIGIWITLRFYKSTNIWMSALKKSEEKFKNVLDNSKDVLYKMDLKSRKYVFVSPALESMLGYDTQNLMEGGVEFILSIMHPDDKKRMNKVVEKYNHLDDGDFLPVVQFRLQDSEGNWKWVSNVRTLVKDENGKPDAIVGAVRDISTQKAQEKKITESLHEKEILLKEIHHRVKNNLAIVSSLLELQKDGVSEEVQKMLSSSQARIKSIAKVHEKLYESTTLSDIPLDTYITEITEEIEKAYKSKEKQIDIKIDITPITVNINEAIPIGLILNELINNAFKHAFSGLQNGILKILLQKADRGMELIVESNGNQMDADFDASKSGSLGMTLIKLLVKRINGKLEIEQDEWTRFKIWFELEKTSPSNIT